MSFQSGGMCKGSFAIGSACGKCSRCLDELEQMNGRAFGPHVVAWKYRYIHLSYHHGKEWSYTDKRQFAIDLAKTGNFLVEGLYDEQNATLDKVAQEALVKIAFDSDVSDLAGNPSLWASTIAYLALGGNIFQGRKVDTKDEVLGRLQR
jgi:hypothetical protein